MSTNVSPQTPRLNYLRFVCLCCFLINTFACTDSKFLSASGAKRRALNADRVTAYDSVRRKRSVASCLSKHRQCRANEICKALLKKVDEKCKVGLRHEIKFSSFPL